MPSPSSFFIRSDYRPRKTVETVGEMSSGEYWTDARIKGALLYQFPVYQYARRLIRRRRAETIVDVGCGVGHKLKYVHSREPQCSYIGIDQASAISYCREHHGFGRWIVDDFENPTDAADGIHGDLVICCDVIEHVLDPDLLLTYLRRVTAPGGSILLSTPDRDAMRGTDCLESPNQFHVREWNRNEFANYLQDRGIRIEAHFNQFASRVGFNSIFMKQLRKRFPRPLRYNQVALGSFGCQP